MSARSRGSRLTPELVLQAYRQGYFPMADSSTGPIAWYSPDPRAIFPLETFHPSRSLRRVQARGTFHIRLNTSFGETIRKCADRAETWISGDIVEVYTRLHMNGFAHSVESWREGQLVGGLYGVSIGGAFFGESMFSRETDASKVALVFLIERLRERHFLLLDAQFITPHLEALGAVTIPRTEYMLQLQRALTVDTSFVDL